MIFIKLTNLICRQTLIVLKSIKVHFYILCLLVVGVQTVATAEPSRAKLKIATSLGDMVFELYPEQAPQTIQHFLLNANQGIYDGTIFHKVVPDFVVQGGGFDVNFRERPVMKQLVHEGQDTIGKGTLRNKYGVISLARGADRDSAGLEFFINVADNTDLDPVVIPPGDPVASFEYNGNTFKNIPRKELLNARQLWGFTPFGSIISGQTVLEKIRKTNTGALGPFSSSVPIVPVVIQSVRLTFNPNNAFAIVPIVSPVVSNTNTATSSTTQVIANPLNNSNNTASSNPTSAQSNNATSTSTEALSSEVLVSLEKWAEAWRTKNVDAYLACYDSSFKTAKFKTHDEWASYRKDRINEKSKISVKIVNPQIKLTGNKAEIKFVQQYSADAINSNSVKLIQMEKINNKWWITKEDS